MKLRDGDQRMLQVTKNNSKESVVQLYHGTVCRRQKQGVVEKANLPKPSINGDGYGDKRYLHTDTIVHANNVGIQKRQKKMSVGKARRGQAGVQTNLSLKVSRRDYGRLSRKPTRTEMKTKMT